MSGDVLSDIRVLSEDPNDLPHYFVFKTLTPNMGHQLAGNSQGWCSFQEDKVKLCVSGSAQSHQSVADSRVTFKQCFHKTFNLGISKPGGETCLGLHYDKVENTQECWHKEDCGVQILKVDISYLDSWVWPLLRPCQVQFRSLIIRIWKDFKL